MKVIILALVVPWIVCAESFRYTQMLECKEFKDCMEALPKGKVAASVVYLADIADYDAMNRVYQSYFPGIKPARNTVEVRLRPGMRMALQATLYLGSGELRGLTPPNVTNVVPITPAVWAGERLFIAGILGRDSNTGVIPGTPYAQIQMCLARLDNIFRTAGLTRLSAVQFTVFHTAKIPRELLTQSLADYFGDSKVAFTILEVPALALGAQVGINGIAEAGN
jgi:enamine deaminase RidA (YjgF/YER057c/UK114 family)